MDHNVVDKDNILAGVMGFDTMVASSPSPATTTSLATCSSILAAFASFSKFSNSFILLACWDSAHELVGEELLLESLEDMEGEVGLGGARTRLLVVQLGELSGVLLARGVVGLEHLSCELCCLYGEREVGGEIGLTHKHVDVLVDTQWTTGAELEM